MRGSGDEVAMRIFVLDQDKLKFRRDFSKVRKGGSGFGVSEEDCSMTLNTRDEAWIATVRV